MNDLFSLDITKVKIQMGGMQGSDLHAIPNADPDPGGKNLRKILKKLKKHESV